jgi:4-carboxymuconolactone decarboxylase
VSIPKPYTDMKERFPDLLKAYESLGDACKNAGPLDAKTVAMIKLAISMTAGLEGAAHSHTRKALEAGCTPEQLEHIAILGVPTTGFPNMMRNCAWIRDVTDQQNG